MRGRRHYLFSRQEAVSYLHLGLYEDGLLNFVGSAPLRVAEGKRLAPLIEGIIEPPGFTGKMPGELRGQFGKVISEWNPLLPSIVAEVQYDHFGAGSGTGRGSCVGGRTRKPAFAR